MTDKSLHTFVRAIKCDLNPPPAVLAPDNESVAMRFLHNQQNMVWRRPDFPRPASSPYRIRQVFVTVFVMSRELSLRLFLPNQSAIKHRVACPPFCARVPCTCCTPFKRVSIQLISENKRR